MNPLPAAYAWIDHVEELPRMVAEARKLYGTLETPGPGDSPTIMSWAREMGLEHVYTADSVAWCGLFVAVVAHRAGKETPAQPLWALNWAHFGKDVGQPGLGDVLTFVRPGGGHVGIYCGEDQGAYHVLGGNQGDAVSIARIGKERLYRARRPLYRTPPSSVKPVILAPTGALSVNEA